MPYPTTEEAVMAAEKALGIRFPSVYCGRLMAMNGGELSTGGDDWNVFPVLDASQSISTRTQDVVTETRKAKELEGFPATAIAIATNAEGDFLLLLKEGQTELVGPQVQRWSRKSREMKAVPLRYDHH